MIQTFTPCSHRGCSHEVSRWLDVNYNITAFIFLLRQKYIFSVFSVLDVLLIILLFTLLLPTTGVSDFITTSLYFRAPVHFITGSAGCKEETYEISKILFYMNFLLQIKYAFFTTTTIKCVFWNLPLDMHKI